MLYDYGLNLGIAFQIIDDILDYTEDQTSIGKPAGNDLRQGMVTLPLIYTLQEQSTDGHRRRVHSVLNGAEHTEEDIRSVVAWVINGDGVQQAQADANRYAVKAREALYRFPSSRERETLDELIDFVVMRKR